MIKISIYLLGTVYPRRIHSFILQIYYITILYYRHPLLRYLIINSADLLRHSKISPDDNPQEINIEKHRNKTGIEMNISSPLQQYPRFNDTTRRKECSA